MKTIKIDLPKELEQVEIHTFADWHIGDAGCDEKLINRQIEAVNNNPNALVILNGDLMNNATKTSVSDSYAELIPPMQQIEMCVNLLAPIKDKIILINNGNHENRTYIKEGVDLTAIVAQQLGIYDKYAKTNALLFVRFGEKQRERSKGRKMCYTIYALHGTGGGRKEGSKANRLADMASIVDADIYIHSHTHLPMVMKQAFYRVSASNSSVACVDKLFVNTAAMLDYGGYGATFEFKPASKDTPIIYLAGGQKKTFAKL